jgi:hypothetical protein
MSSVKIAGNVINGGPNICEDDCPTEKGTEGVPARAGFVLR